MCIKIVHKKDKFFTVWEYLNEPYLIRLPNETLIHFDFIPSLKAKYKIEIFPFEKYNQLRHERKFRLSLKENPDKTFSEFFVKEKQPLHYQLIGMNFIYNAKSVLLADDVGLGKTLQSIGALIRSVIENKIDIGIIFCPNTLKFQWEQEFENSLIKEVLRKIRIFRIRGEKGLRNKFYSMVLKCKKVPVLLLNYELFLRDYIKINQVLKKFKRRFVICDEASRIKNPNTKTHKLICKFFSKSEYKVCLTATPIENGLEDLYGIMRLVDKALFWSYRFFCNRYLQIEEFRNFKTGGIYKKVVGYKKLDEVRYRLSPYYLQRTTKDLELELPRILISNYPVDLTETQKEIYEKIRSDIDWEDKRTNILAQFIHLRKACNSPNLFEGYSGKSSKIEEIKILLSSELRNKKVIIFSESKKFIKEMIKELKDFKPAFIYGGMKEGERDMQYSIFNKGKTRLLLMTSAGERGLNFPSANVVINADLPYNPARLKQRIGRARRLDSKTNVLTVINLYARDTIEERVFEIFHNKAKLFSKIFDDSFDLERVKINIEKWDKDKLKSLIEGKNGIVDN